MGVKYEEDSLMGFEGVGFEAFVLDRRRVWSYGVAVSLRKVLAIRHPWSTSSFILQSTRVFDVS